MHGLPWVHSMPSWHGLPPWESLCCVQPGAPTWLAAIWRHAHEGCPRAVTQQSPSPQTGWAAPPHGLGPSFGCHSKGAGAACKGELPNCWAEGGASQPGILQIAVPGRSFKVLLAGLPFTPNQVGVSPTCMASHGCIPCHHGMACLHGRACAVGSLAYPAGWLPYGVTHTRGALVL
jgi:hypothetical protein